MEKQDEATQIWGRDSYSNWQGYQDRRNEKEEERSVRRRGNSRDNFIDAEKGERMESKETEGERKGDSNTAIEKDTQHQ